MKGLRDTFVFNRLILALSKSSSYLTVITKVLRSNSISKNLCFSYEVFGGKNIILLW